MAAQTGLYGSEANLNNVKSTQLPLMNQAQISNLMSLQADRNGRFNQDQLTSVYGKTPTQGDILAQQNALMKIDPATQKSIISTPEGMAQYNKLEQVRGSIGNGTYRPTTITSSSPMPPQLMGMIQQDQSSRGPVRNNSARSLPSRNIAPYAPPLPARNLAAILSRKF